VAPGLIDPEEIEQEKIALGPSFCQEYECNFLNVQNAAVPPELIDGSLADYELDKI